MIKVAEAKWTAKKMHKILCDSEVAASQIFKVKENYYSFLVFAKCSLLYLII